MGMSSTILEIILLSIFIKAIATIGAQEQSQKIDNIPTGNRMDVDWMRTPSSSLDAINLPKEPYPISFLRLSRNPNGFIRFGKSDKSFLRFGRSGGNGQTNTNDNNFARNDRSGADDILSSDANMRFGRRGDKFIRFGRSQGKNLAEIHGFTRYVRGNDKGAIRFAGKRDSSGNGSKKLVETFDILMNNMAQEQEPIAAIVDPADLSQSLSENDIISELLKNQGQSPSIFINDNDSHEK